MHRFMAVSVFQYTITQTHDQHQKSTSATAMRETALSLLFYKTFNSESTCGFKISSVSSYGDDMGPQRMYINTFGGLSSSRILHTSFSVLLKQEIMNAWLCASFPSFEN